MGYSTEFTGVFKLDRPLKKEHLDYLMAFHEMFHIRWKASEIEKIPDPIREAVNLPIGEDGRYFVVVDPYPYMEEHGLSPSDLIFEDHPSTGASLYCQWQPSKNGQYIEWDGTGKFGSYIFWLDILIEDFLESWGYKLNGIVIWQGEDREDFGTMVVVDNQLEVLRDVLKQPTLPDLEESG